ncbi:uncharacterized protein I303_101009 [Kwoniella dejecticola CBS 10117]|uniref:Golgi apparatus membrane protein TVP38 n=1 Tax=Kwoniella dejecticola CBS 10117 TaxID=1296121 RepID=A0A1A6AGJ2_9TREE|nr:uncharacterized protein I303_01013 [Kwoniella dejecticola CBS 10117]OBR89189.1 hypothetical protein I303_01013 [Kwoniella dejecticola CBS 10117]
MRLPLSTHLHRIRRPSPSLARTRPVSPQSHIPDARLSDNADGRAGIDTSRPVSPSIGNSAPSHRRDESVDTSSQSVFQLFKEDYVSVRLYVKEMDYKEAMRKAMRRHMYKWYAILVIAIVLTALITSKHETIVEFCEPVTRTIRDWPGGWLIPLAILIVVSFPPLVGHEIIGILCGLVYGLWVGFAILAAGTFLGEIATWIAFKWCCQGRAAKFEKKNKLYASLTQLIREKSFMFTLVLRFSAVPGHIVTAVSASAGANFWMYLAAAFLTLPKQFTIVYLGKAFGTQSRKNTIISIITTVLTLIGTVVAAVYIYYQMRIVMRRNSALSLPTTVENIDSSMTMSEFPDEKGGSTGVGVSNNLHARRPWLYTNNSTYSSTGSASGFRTPTRSWSMPGHMNEEELREWVQEMEHEQSASVKLNSHIDAPAIKIDAEHGEPLNGMFDNLPSVFTPGLMENPDSRYRLGFSGTSISPSGTSTPAYMENDGLISTEDLNLSTTYPPTPPKRGESSTPVPKSSTDTPSGRGGREIADEADLYAISKGARRPEYGRMRGDSRAALLGRQPHDDTALEMGGVDPKGFYSSSPSWKRDYTRSRGDSGVSILGRPTSEDLGDALVSWKRDYGRSRGESGAALLGRPSSTDLDLNRSTLLETSGTDRTSEDKGKGVEVLKD